ncbi:aerobic carbon-monoxide dehydrogenase medium subunit [Anaerolineae bacterium]|nr:aerobic carbon-monoxide dehydrogenase medium subunit [Anaerolineae bacterium]
MLNLKEIHKPATLADALKLLQQPGTVALAGGSALIADQRRDVQAVVDLSALGLAYIRESSGAIALGAMTTLAELNDSPILRALANGLIAQAAHRSTASVLRNQATIAGTLISEPAGILAVALLALDAQMTLMEKTTRTIALAEFLRELRESREIRKSLVTEISVPMTNPRASMHIVARTPSDKPIVSVIASARIENQVARDVRIALGGVGETALRASAAEKILEGQTLNDALIENAVGAIHESPLHPRGDFRGSAEYRKEMAIVLTRRAVKELIA